MAEIKVELQPILEKVGEFLVSESKRLVPVDNGILRTSITYRLGANGTSVDVYSPLDYAEDMEFGKPPEPLSETEKEDVEAWAKRHGLKSGKGIIWSLEHKGIKVGTATQPLHITSLGRDSYRPFLRPALYNNIPQIKKIIKDWLK